MTNHIPDNPDKVWKSHSNNEQIFCPKCSEESFRYVPINGDTEIDTIGSVKICSTNQGIYFH